MRLCRYLEEEWATRIDSIKKDVDIFVNPDKNDMAELGNECRFVADNKKKKLYVWNAWQAYHKHVAKRIFGSFIEVSDDKKLYGTAEKRGIKWKMSKSLTYKEAWYDGHPPPPKTMLKLYSWVNKWIDIKEYFKSYESEEFQSYE